MTMVQTRSNSPWHPGEMAMQESVGVAERMAEIGPRVLRDHLIPQHREFYPLLPFAVLGAVDRRGDVWATIRGHNPGFLHAPDPFHLAVDLPRMPDDPAEAGIEDGDAVALLGIHLETRRRNRLNGIVHRRTSGGFVIEVRQSFGNCPRYIWPRLGHFARDPDLPPTATAQTSTRLDAEAAALVKRADTFFIATSVDRAEGWREVDVSHRGGPPGFVRIEEDGALTVPDYPGNMFFNTLGNIRVNGRAGLTFADFSTGDLLQMTGGAEVLPDGPSIAAFEHAERLWRFHPRRIVRRPDAFPLRFA